MSKSHHRICHVFRLNQKINSMHGAAKKMCDFNKYFEKQLHLKIRIYGNIFHYNIYSYPSGNVRNDKTFAFLF